MTPVPSPSPFLDSVPASAMSSATTMIGLLLIVCVAAFFILRFIYGRGPQNGLGFGKRLVRVLDRFPLGPQRYLLVVEIGGKIYLLGVTEHSINMLTTLDSEELKNIDWVDQRGGNFAPFQSYLSALSQRWKRTKEEPPK